MTDPPTESKKIVPSSHGPNTHVTQLSDVNNSAK
jgi:hypothetical protein